MRAQTGRKPELHDLFYALLLDEIACQPNLRKELGANELGNVALRAFGWALERIGAEVEKAYSWLGESYVVGPGLGIVKQLLPRPASLLRDVADILAMIFGSNYDALCRSALLHLFWGEIGKAERKINLAKYKHNERAFAHHVYGLLRGLQGDREGARFELGLALQREEYEGARQRIARALRALA
jgi:hypothetical protein